MGKVPGDRLTAGGRQGVFIVEGGVAHPHQNLTLRKIGRTQRLFTPPVLAVSFINTPGLELSIRGHNSSRLPLAYWIFWLRSTLRAFHKVCSSAALTESPSFSGSFCLR